MGSICLLSDGGLPSVLAELASDINMRVQAVFGGNYPALVWLNDCYEFDPNNATKDMQLRTRAPPGPLCGGHAHPQTV